MAVEAARSPASSWHATPVDACLAELRTSPRGLAATEVETRRARYGWNHLSAPPRRGAAMRLFAQFRNLLIYVLLGAAVITGLLQQLADTAVILAVVIANALIGFIQEGKAERAMDAIRGMLAPHAAVLRDGERRTVAGEDVVPGDIVLLEAGDKVPADLRLLQVHGLSIQEAILSGESVPVDKGTTPVDAEAPLPDRTSMAFSGTLVTRGQGTGIVVGTGRSTEIGRISGMMAAVEIQATPLIRQMDAFARWLTLLILAVSTILFVFGYFVAHHDFTTMFMIVVGLAVSAIPEGLPAVLTITLAIGVHAMARRHAIVRRLPAIETLGSVSVICTDKTGTLTRNEMMVAAAVTAAGGYAIDGEGYRPVGTVAPDDPATVDTPAVLTGMARVAVLCNDATLREVDGTWHVEGDPMEGALLAFAGKTGVRVAAERRAWTRIDAIPFDARHRFMATLVHDHAGHGCILVKGAPERLLGMCRAQRMSTGTGAPVDMAFWSAAADRLAARGQRVLAFAERVVPASQTSLTEADVDGRLDLLGIVGLVDPPRTEAIAAVAECRGAGIRVKMITGDHAGTARAIAREIGLDNPAGVLTGADIDRLDDAALATAVLETDVFARTSPEHKLRLVTALQAHGLTVAMTGDGVNDAPALKRADAGIAMGMKGSEAAKEAAEVVLADDNFASIVAAVREGRTVYDNIRKVIGWTLPTNAGEAATIITALLLGITLPVTPIQILWINLVTAVTLGMALAFEPTEASTMRRPPRPRNESLLAGGLAWQIVLAAVLFAAGVFGVFAYALDRGHSLDLARTLAVNTLVVLEIAYLFVTRNLHGTSLTWRAVRGTPIVWLTVGVVTALQFAFTYAPPLQAVFATEAVPWRDGVVVLGAGIALFTLVELEKQLRLRLQAMRGR
ncbi:MAG: cation-transporting P-type ATPase [Casimicrobiaceae bacterium]